MLIAYVAPPPKDAPVRVDIGKLDGPASALAAIERAMEALAAGELTPSEAGAVVDLLNAYRTAWADVDVAERLKALEQHTGVAA